MPRDYKHIPGSKRYRNYDEGTLKKCVTQAKKGFGQNQMSRRYSIPKSTLSRKVRGIQKKRCGGQLALSEEFEVTLAGIIGELAKWKVPMPPYDVRLMVKYALDVAKIRHKIFRDNLPGPDWLNGFKKRHGLTSRIPDNVTASRFEISEEQLVEYYDNLKITLRDVSPDNIYNYDETSVSDDPLSKKVLVRRGFGRVEKKSECERLGYSVMFSGNAAGEYLPPMVVYKAVSECLYREWVRDGPNGALYGSTVSGWFNKKMFEQWYKKLFLSAVNKKDGPKVIIGDNLSSHLSMDVVTSCIKHNVRFATLIPYSTHFLQPLDVAVFAPLKKIWRLELDDWRNTCNHNARLTKDHFPYRLKRLIGECDNEIARQRVAELKAALISGFRSTGIYPFDPEKGLRKLPGRQTPEDPVSTLNSAVTKILKRHCSTKGSVKIKRGKKINVAPGQAVTEKEIINEFPEVWTCSGFRCGKNWVKDDNRWIVCDRESCARQYHLQCSGISYEKEQYNDFDIASLNWTCNLCD